MLLRDFAVAGHCREATAWHGQQLRQRVRVYLRLSLVQCRDYCARVADACRSRGTDVLLAGDLHDGGCSVWFDADEIRPPVGWRSSHPPLWGIRQWRMVLVTCQKEG